MKVSTLVIAAVFTAGSCLLGCSSDEAINPHEIPAEVLQQVAAAGFSTEGISRIDEGYLIENDIYLTAADLRQMGPGQSLAIAEQYRTNNLVNGTRTITLYAAEGGKRGYSPGMIAGLDEAIARYNAMNLRLTFQRITKKKGADITMTRLSSRDEQRGVLGSAGFPTNSGDPYNQIKMSGILESTYGLNTDEIASIIAHEIGHCIGFRHTDYMNRSYSCGSGGNEGSAGVGAVHIPGTPTGPDNNSWMLACTDGSNRPFNNNDKTALNYLY